MTKWQKFKVLDRISHKLTELRRLSEKAFIPYICAGDPDFSATRDLALTLEDSGADLMELGVPFSDPIADGPTIQMASERALKSGTTLLKILDFVSDFRKSSQCPIALMSYYNPIFRMGVDRFCELATSAGVDGVIIPDLPIEEANPLREVALKFGLATIFLVAPTTPIDRLKKIAELSSGFIYAVSVMGVTGMRSEISDELVPMVEKLRPLTGKPINVGFGVSTPEQAADVVKVADGVVVGSAIIKVMERALDNRSVMLSSVGKFARDLVSSIKK